MWVHNFASMEDKFAKTKNRIVSHIVIFVGDQFIEDRQDMPNKRFQLPMQGFHTFCQGAGSK
jgi:hypothetical protein